MSTLPTQKLNLQEHKKLDGKAYSIYNQYIYFCLQKSIESKTQNMLTSDLMTAIRTLQVNAK